MVFSYSVLAVNTQGKSPSGGRVFSGLWNLVPKVQFPSFVF